jgi:hypothetical protein
MPLPGHKDVEDAFAIYKFVPNIVTLVPPLMPVAYETHDETVPAKEFTTQD